MFIEIKPDSPRKAGRLIVKSEDIEYIAYNDQYDEGPYIQLKTAIADDKDGETFCVGLGEEEYYRLRKILVAPENRVYGNEYDRFCNHLNPDHAAYLEPETIELCKEDFENYPEGLKALILEDREEEAKYTHYAKPLNYTGHA